MSRVSLRRSARWGRRYENDFAGGAPAAAAPSAPWQVLLSALGLTTNGALYDGLVNFNASSNLLAVLGDVRGVGYSTLFSGGSGSTNKPGYNGVTGAITFDGVTSYMNTAADARFDVSGPYSIWGVMSAAGAANWLHGISDSGSLNRGLVFKSRSSSYWIGGSGGDYTGSGVAVDSNIRLVIGWGSPANGSGIQVPNQAASPAGNVGVSAGNNTLTLGGYFQNAQAPSVLYAFGCLPRIATVGDIAALKTYAATKNYVPA